MILFKMNRQTNRQTKKRFEIKHLNNNKQINKN